ncbi:LETM1 domain-containing protein ylh47 [Spiromyces aspiralis]|uniref:LETM1 domain-containing protein ylh47 n=1 Tax=Spiromyces aspiralis TaxID=68401 RepID=A0ACC1HGZ4_9FUNG|nr:LETM1 domain-containing protein ylh47 [Spiromyces aspiralis]
MRRALTAIQLPFHRIPGTVGIRGTLAMPRRPAPIYFVPSLLTKQFSHSAWALSDQNRPAREASQITAIKPSTELGLKEPPKPGVVDEPIEVAKKKSLGQRIMHEIHHYWDGTKLFAKELRISSRLVWKMARGGDLSRRELRQLRRTIADMARLVPFIVLLIIPFAELLLPVLLKLFPNMLPSTYEDAKLKEKKYLRLQQVRAEMSRYLKETIAETSRQRKALQSASDEVKMHAINEYVDTQKLLNQIRSSGEQVPNEVLLRVAQVFEDDMTLDNLTRPQLVSICRYMGINSFGTDNYLKYQVQNRMRYITADDKMIKAEGVDSLTISELQAACQARGIRFMGVSPARMRSDLQQWLDLHLGEGVPATILILSRILTAGEPVTTLTPEVLQATLSSLPDNLVNEATLRLAELGGAATNKQKLDVLEEQEYLIEDEAEQEQKEREVKVQQQQQHKEKETASEQGSQEDRPELSQQHQQQQEQGVGEKTRDAKTHQ